MIAMEGEIAKPEQPWPEGSLGEEIVGRIEALAAISEETDNLTRIFLSLEHRKAANLILAWMREAGMWAQLDAIGNVCGRYEGERPNLDRKSTRLNSSHSS